VRLFAGHLRELCALPVHFFDERLSSFAAEEHLRGSGLTHKGKRRRRDALAAAEILRGFLAKKSRP
jgi:putative Holliday junction resolvase